MGKFPGDAPPGAGAPGAADAGLRGGARGAHLALHRRNADGTVPPLTLPNPPKIKGSTLRTICRQADISREELLKAYEEAWRSWWVRQPSDPELSPPVLGRARLSCPHKSLVWKTHPLSCVATYARSGLTANGIS
jgi:hypothetical protein